MICTMRRTWFLFLLLGLVLSLPSASHAQLTRGAEFLVNGRTAGRQAVPDVATAPDGHFVVVWVDGGVRGAPSNVMARVLTANGTPRTGDLRVSSLEPGFQDHPRVAMAADGKFVVVWQSRSSAQAQSRVYGRRFSASGQPAGQRFRLGAGYGRDQFEPDVAAAPDGRFVVAWTELDGQFDPEDDAPMTDVLARRFGAGGQPLAQEWTAAGGWYNQYAPAVAVNRSGAFAIAVEDYSESNAHDDGESDAYAYTYGPDGTLRHFLFPPIYGGEHVGDEQLHAAVALADDGTAVLAWYDSEADDSDDEDYWSNAPGILAQRFDAAGEIAGLLLRTATTILNVQTDVALSTAPGGFLIAWTSEGGQDGDGRGVFAQRLAADGTKIGPETALATYIRSNQSLPAVAVAPDGRGLAVWQSMRRDGDDFGVAARRVYLKPR
jgi:large repetitive protein